MVQFFGGTLTGYEFIINLVVTLMMSVSVVATIFSGWEYVKKVEKNLFKRVYIKGEVEFRTSEKKSRGIKTFTKILYTKVF